MNKLVIFFLVTLNFRLVGFYSRTGTEQESAAKYWWQIEIAISVSGEYEYRNNINTSKGEYSFDVVLFASMERDNGDYLLYKGEKKIESISWKEVLYQKNESNKKVDLSKSISPVIELYYVMRREGKIHFDCAISSIPLPFASKKPAKKLILPRSAENEYINPKTQYNSGIVKGSNRVDVTETRIYQEKEISEVFNWSWQGARTAWPLGSSSHSVELKLIIRRLEK